MQPLIRESRSNSILILDEVNMRAKIIPKDRERHYLMIKASIYSGDIVIRNVCTKTTELQNMQSKTELN